MIFPLKKIFKSTIEEYTKTSGMTISASTNTLEEIVLEIKDTIKSEEEVKEYFAIRIPETADVVLDYHIEDEDGNLVKDYPPKDYEGKLYAKGIAVLLK